MTQAPSIKEALERSIVAIDDWLNVYASELCNQDRVDEANHRISNAGGTLAYIANVQQQNRAALATLQPSGERRDAIAKELWHRFSPPHHIDWESEPHKGEYLKCADEIISLLRLGWFGSGLVQDEAGSVATWMIQHGYVTGHGDTLDDLLGGLVAAEREKCAKEIDARAEEIALKQREQNPLGTSYLREAKNYREASAAIRSARDGGAES